MPYLLSCSRLFAVALCVLLLGSATAGYAQDKRVARMLEKLGYTPELMAGRFYKIEDSVPGPQERNTRVFVTVKTAGPADLPMRELYAVVYNSKRRPAQRIYEYILGSAERRDLGAYTMLQFDDDYIIFYRVMVPEKMNKAQWRAALDDVIAGADQMEEELTNRDLF